MSPKRVLVEPARTPRKPRVPVSVRNGWKWVGWLGAVLAAEGLADFVLGWVPLHLGTAEWEFATVAATYSGLPLVTLGLAGVLASALGLGVPWAVRTVAWFLIGFAVLLGAGLALFWLDVPLALRSVSGPAKLGVTKAIVKTTVLATGFGAAYVIGGVAALKHLRKEVE